MNVALVAASRDVLPGRQDLLSCCPSRSILPEWTFGKAEPSSHSNTEQTQERTRFAAIYVELVAAGRDVLPGRQDLLSCCPSTSILPEWTFGEAEPSSYGNTC